MLRMIIPILFLSSGAASVWFVSSTVAAFRNRSRLRREYPEAFAKGETDAPDADAYVRERLETVNFWSRVRMAALAFGTPAAVIGLLYWLSTRD